MRNVIIFLFTLSTSPMLKADTIQKLESPVVEGFVLFKIVSETYPYGRSVDAKGGRYVYEKCGTLDLVEGRHYSLSEAKTARSEMPGVGGGTINYREIYPGPECK